MKAIRIHEYGPPEVLRLEDVPVPSPGPGQVLIRIRAASVNPVDWLIRSGAMAPYMPPEFPMCLGYDLAGDVLECGAGTERFQQGTRVFALSNKLFGEAYAEFIALDEAYVALIPEQVSYQEAAAVPGAALTALQSLRDLGNVRPRLRVMIIGGSGGVGTFAVQLAARVWDCHVTAVTSTGNVELVRRLGAEDVIDYTREDLHRAEGRYDILLDAVGEERFETVHHLLTPTGCYITTKQGEELDKLRILELTGFHKEHKSVQLKLDAHDLHDLATLLEAGQIKPVIDRVYPLEAVADAHRYSETRRAKGKIVVEPPNA